MSVVVVLLLIGLAATAYMILEQRGGVDSAQVSRPTREIVQLALTSIPGGTMSMRSSWMPIGQDSHSAGFTYRRRKSILVAFVLFFFFLIPCIFYLVFGGKNQTLQVNVLEGTAGLSTVQVASSGAVARRRGRAFLRSVAGERGVQTVPSEQVQTVAPPEDAAPALGAAPAGEAQLVSGSSSSLASSGLAGRTTCPSCHAATEGTALFCRSCGAMLDQSPVAPTCPGCGKEVEESARFCRHCGEGIPV